MPRLDAERIAADEPVDQLVALYTSARRRIEALIHDSIERGHGFTLDYRHRQLDRVNTILRQLGLDAEPLARGAVSLGYSLAANAVDVATPGLGAGQLAGGAVHRDAMRALAVSMNDHLFAAHQTVGRRVDDTFRRLGLEAAGRGLAAGEGPVDIAHALRADLLHNGITGFVDRAGRRWALDVYARMVARTTVREAVSAGTMNRLKEYGADLVTVSDHGDTDAICADYQGNTYSMGGADPRYPLLPTAPPFHPNCVHVLTPASATFDRFEAALLNGPPSAPDVPAKTNPVRELIAREDDKAYKVWLGELGIPDRKVSRAIWANRAHTLRHDAYTRIGRRVRRRRDAVLKSETRKAERELAKAQEASKAAIRKLRDARSADEFVAARIAQREAAQVSARLGDVVGRAKAAAVRRALAEARPGFGTGKIKVRRRRVTAANRDTIVGAIDDTAASLPREWIDAMNDDPVRFTEQKKRAFYSSGDRSVHSNANPSTIMHELGHHAEATVRALADAIHDFYRHRTLGDPLRPLADLKPGHGYKADERVREDKFVEPYMGKDYPGGAGGKFHELLTCGLEHVFHGRYRDLETDDPEMYDWLLGILAAH